MVLSIYVSVQLLCLSVYDQLLNWFRNGFYLLRQIEIIYRNAESRLRCNWIEHNNFSDNSFNCIISCIKMIVISSINSIERLTILKEKSIP